VLKRLLVVFGKRTADEIVSTAKLSNSHFFDRLMTYYFDECLAEELRLDSIPRDFDEVYFCIGVVDYNLRVKIETAATRRGMIPFTIIHPSSVVDVGAQIGVGCFIGPLAVISIDARIGDHSILHIHCSVGHDTLIGRHCAILPGARLSGDVTLGDGVLIGSNAFVFQGSRIGDHTQVDALTYVRGDVQGGQILSLRYPSPLKRFGWKAASSSDGVAREG
jgi:UDP-3-O-[3-hydroxymyristoyl] glucosamine N-acyltransferase